jgi:hypothetical protein
LSSAAATTVIAVTAIGAGKLDKLGGQLEQRRARASGWSLPSMRSSSPARPEIGSVPPDSDSGSLQGDLQAVHPCAILADIGNERVAWRAICVLAVHANSLKRPPPGRPRTKTKDNHSCEALPAYAGRHPDTRNDYH